MREEWVLCDKHPFSLHENQPANPLFAVTNHLCYRQTRLFADNSPPERKKIQNLFASGFQRSSTCLIHSLPGETVRLKSFLAPSCTCGSVRHRPTRITFSLDQRKMPLCRSAHTSGLRFGSLRSRDPRDANCGVRPIFSVPANRPDGDQLFDGGSLEVNWPFLNFRQFEQS